MAQSLDSYFWARQPLCDEAPPLVDEILVPGYEDDSPLTTAERHRRREAIGRRYLRGCVPLIQSAQLLGPFDRSSGWLNPWSDHPPCSTSQHFPGAATRNYNTVVGTTHSGPTEKASLFDNLAPFTSRKQDVNDEDDGMIDDNNDIPDKSDNQRADERPLSIEWSCGPNQAGSTSAVSGPCLERREKRRVDAIESWLKGAHIIKRPRGSTYQNSSPTPAGGVKRCHQSSSPRKLIQVTTPAQSRLHSPKASSIFGPPNRDADALSTEEGFQSSGFIPLKSSGQPTPPSEYSDGQEGKKRKRIVGSSRVARCDRTVSSYERNESPNLPSQSLVQHPEISADILDEHYQRPKPGLSGCFPEVDFMYRKTKEVPKTTMQSSKSSNLLVTSSADELPVEADVTVLLSTDKLVQFNHEQKRLVTFGDVDSPGITNLARERHKKRRQNRFYQPILADKDLMSSETTDYSLVTTVDERETQLDVDSTKNGHEEEERADTFDLTDEAVQSQVLSEANEFRSEQPISYKLFIDAKTTHDGSQLSLTKRYEAHFSDTASGEKLPSHHVEDSEIVSHDSVNKSSHNESPTSLRSSVVLVLPKGQQVYKNQTSTELSEQNPRVVSGARSVEQLLSAPISEGPQKNQSHDRSTKKGSDQSSSALEAGVPSMNKSASPAAFETTDSRQNFDQNLEEDHIMNVKLEVQQSPWCNPERVIFGIKSATPHATEDAVGTREDDQLPEIEEMNARVLDPQQTPWTLNSLAPAALYHTVHVAAKKEHQVDVEIEGKSDSVPLVDNIFSDAESLTSLAGQHHNPVQLDPFAGTQVLTDATTANPWAGSSRKRRSEKQKRVSWGPLPADHLNNDRAVPRSSRHMYSPPPSQDSLQFADPEDSFYQLLGVGRTPNPALEHSAPSRDVTEKGALGYKAQAVLHHMARGAAAPNSPAIDAMAKAFIAADRHCSHEIFDSGNKDEQTATSKAGEFRAWCLQSGRSEGHRNSRDLSGMSFSITPGGEITPVGPSIEALENDEELGAVIDDMSSFLEGWDVDTELRKAGGHQTNRESSGNGWSQQEYLVGM